MILARWLSKINLSLCCHMMLWLSVFTTSTCTFHVARGWYTLEASFLKQHIEWCSGAKILIMVVGTVACKETVEIHCAATSVPLYAVFTVSKCTMCYGKKWCTKEATH